jgi:hypothetical protein
MLLARQSLADSSEPTLRHPTPVDPLPQIDPRYSIERELGRGGMGRVFAARDETRSPQPVRRDGERDRRPARKRTEEGRSRVESYIFSVRMEFGARTPRTAALHQSGEHPRYRRVGTVGVAL